MRIFHRFRIRLTYIVILNLQIRYLRDQSIHESSLILRVKGRTVYSSCREDRERRSDI